MNRSSSRFELQYMKLDPSNDDQDGSVALVGDIEVEFEIITGVDGAESMWPAIAIDSNDDIHVAWQDQRDSGDNFGLPQIFYSMLNNQGTTLIDDTRLTPGSTIGTHPDIVAIPQPTGDDLVDVVWDGVYGGEGADIPGAVGWIEGDVILAGKFASTIDLGNDGYESADGSPDLFVARLTPY